MRAIHTRIGLAALLLIGALLGIWLFFSFQDRRIVYPAEGTRSSLAQEDRPTASNPSPSPETYPEEGPPNAASGGQTNDESRPPPAPEPTEPLPEQPETGTAASPFTHIIEGYVVDDFGGRVQDAKINIKYQWYRSPPPNPAGGGSGARLVFHEYDPGDDQAFATTDAVGYFRGVFSVGGDQIIHRLHLYASVEGMVDSIAHSIDKPRNKGQSTVTLKVSRPGSIEGSVRYHDGTLAAGVRVRITFSGYGGLQASVANPETWTATTDSHGRFQIEGIRPATYSLEVIDESVEMPDGPRSVKVTPGGVALPPVLVVKRRSGIRLRLVNAQSELMHVRNQVPIWLTFHSATGESVRIKHTRGFVANGALTTHDAPEGTVSVTVEFPGYEGRAYGIQLTPGEIYDAGEIIMRPTPD